MTNNEIIELALEKGYKPKWGTQPAIADTDTEEDILLKFTSIAKWLRDTFGYFFTINFFVVGKWHFSVYKLEKNNRQIRYPLTKENKNSSYEESFIECVYETLKLLK